MNEIDKNKILKMLGIIALIFVAVGTLTHFHKKNSVTLRDYAAKYPEQAYGKPSDAADFYCEPLSENLQRYITGISYPSHPESAPDVSFDELRYVHILHYNFENMPAEGELICNAAVAQDIMEIFYELYRNEYQIEKIVLIEEYGGDENASAEANNTFCFNAETVENQEPLSRHALGLAIDINPLYNPRVAYTADGNQDILPASAEKYADRSGSFPYKIDENDLCYKLFTERGFLWGGNQNAGKDYACFQKPPDAHE